MDDDDAGGDNDPNWDGEQVPFIATGSTAGMDPEDGLTGTIWAAGTHTPYVNGRPMKIHVPVETIGPTFEALRKRVADGNVGIGFDHPGENTVAAQTPLGEIGDVSGVARSADGEQIVLTDSELTNSKAEEAFAAGDFDDFDYSVIGKFVPRTGDNSERVMLDDGALDLAAVRIHRVDVVDGGAVGGASVGAMPTLAARAGAIARGKPRRSADGFVATLRAAAADIGRGHGGAGGDDSGAGVGNDNGENRHMSDNNGGSGGGSGTFPWDRDPETVAAAQSALDEASSLVEAKDETIADLEAEKDTLEARAGGFAEIAASHGFDIDDEDFEAQAVIDAHTEDLRSEVATLEASLPAHDTDEEDIESRAEDLKGESVADLEAMAGDLSREALRSKERAAELGGAIAASEMSGSGKGLLGGGSAGSANDGGEDPEVVSARAAGVLSAQDVLEVQAADADPAEYVREKYDVNPAEHADEDSLMAAIGDAKAGGRGGGDA